jgi:hypothetical protein
MKKKIICMLSITVMLVALMSSPVYAWSQTKKITVPGKGTLESYTGRSIWATSSGNTYQWNYEVRANFYYSSDYTRRMLNGDPNAQLFRHVEAKFTGQASMKNSGSVNLGVGKGNVSAGSSTAWQVVSQSHSIQNQYHVHYKSNFVIAPKNEFKTNSNAITNTARVTFHDWTWQHITSGV